MMRRPGRDIGSNLSRKAAAGSRLRRALCRFVLLLPMLLVSTLAIAQIVPPNQGAGRERERFEDPTPPRAQPGGASISLPSTTAPAAAKSIHVVISRVRIVGATVYGDADFAPLYQDLIGRRVPLQAVYDLAQRITAKYGEDGYILSRAIVPVQELKPRGAVVRIEVIEGYIEKVVWPERVSHYRDFFTDYARKVTADRPANIRTLERYLLLANDLPGLRFSTTLKASPSRRGASILIVELSEKPFDLGFRFDNRGTQARGPLQFLTTVTFNNLMRQHEALSLSYATVSPIKELQYVSAAYRQVLNSEGLTAFINGSYSWSHPGTPELQALDFRTRSYYAEAGAQYPIIRARERNLTIVALAFAGENYNFWNLTPDDPQAADRLRGFRLRMEGDYADKTGAINQFSVTFSHGIEGLGSTNNGNPLASRLGGRVDFSKVEGLASRLQPLFDRFSAFVSAYAQYAFEPLLVPEQCSYGGRVFGRAYDPSELLGDHCIMALGELRYDVPSFVAGPRASAQTALTPWPTVQLYGFTDVAKVYTLGIGSVGTVATTVTAASAGGGIRLGFWDRVNLDLSAAKAIEGPRNGWRYFFIASARY
jgi:hemolysin activation/secretion protein